MDNFTAALEHVFEVEGGYSDHPDDKGGETRFGITQKTYDNWVSTNPDFSDYYPFVSINRQIAARIYRELYWEKIRGDELPTGLSLMVFDSAVHAGPVRAIKWLQEALGEEVDGIFGPITLKAATYAVRASRNTYVIERITVYRLMLARKNETFVKGWFNRVVKTLAASIEAVYISSALQRFSI